ncbi:PREDICTED: patched domain-containing protein 3-like [Nanorana parkeri]|uniref:patched domain-containing protein 3-like n=1 Tax=Nanorana parkeri TaxID=125878 RepID=UPI000854F991|nr:PREDICTED: patched domain-containing protein 3-like [Nanorana parkeri]
MARCRTDCIQKPLSLAFYKFGKVVGRYPWWFFLIPMVISAGLGAGFYFLPQREANDIENEFTPVGGPAKSEREFVRTHFPTNDSGHFSAQRLYTEGSFLSIIAVSLSDNIINVDSFRELVKLDEMVQNLNITITKNNANVILNFQHLCTKVQLDECAAINPLLSKVQSNVNLIETLNISYPLFEGRTFLGTSLGGVKLNPNNTVQSAKAVRLVYYLREDNQQDRERSLQWIEHFIKYASQNIEILQLKNVKASYFSSISRQQEFEGTTKSVIPLYSITYFITIFFSIISCIRRDCVRNKTWVASFGVISAGLAVLSSFGLLLLCGVPFVATVANAPFLILGVGIDDMFIMVSSWQQTKVKSGVEERMGETYKEAAVSIIITTLTDVIAFYIGIITSFKSVQSFCIYTGTAILFCFLYNVTCFGAVLALNGRREESNRHWLVCKKVPEKKDDSRSTFYNVCCTGGRFNADTGTETDHPMTNFFHKYYGPFLTTIWTMVIVLVLYGGYLAVSIYGCFQVQEGIDLRNLATDSSYVRSFYDNEDLYFNDYGPRVMVVVTEEVPYWDADSRNKTGRCMESFKSIPYVSEDLSESWLKAYLGFAELLKVNVNDKNNFVGNLSRFLTFFPDFKQDVEIQSAAIITSRFFIQTVNVVSAIDEKNMLIQVRDTAKSCEVPVLVYHPAFIYFDQYAVIIQNTIQNVALATLVMFVISLLLIPNPLCSIWVTFTIASIIVGVTGFMALWNVNLDSISMINLVICIGFSVDFSAHISYAFVSSEKSTANERVKDALHSLGYPVVQGGLSTILGVIVLSTSQSYIFRTFFKIIFLVIAFGMLHGLVVLPVLLALFGTCGKKQVDSKGIHLPQIKSDPQNSDLQLSFSESKIHNRTTCYTNEKCIADPDCP